MYLVLGKDDKSSSGRMNSSPESTEREQWPGKPILLFCSLPMCLSPDLKRALELKRLDQSNVGFPAKADNERGLLRPSAIF